MRNPYEVLGIPVGSSLDDVKRAYRDLARQYNNDYQKMDELNAAYDMIIMNFGNQNRQKIFTGTARLSPVGRETSMRQMRAFAAVAFSGGASGRSESGEEARSQPSFSATACSRASAERNAPGQRVLSRR